MKTLKTMLKATGWILAIFFVVGMFGRLFLSLPGAGGHSINNSLKTQVQSANRACPIPINGIGDVTAITLDDNLVTYTITFQDQYYATCESAYKNESGKEVIMLSMRMLNGQNGQGDELLNTLINENVGIKYIIQSRSGAQHFEITITPDELKTLSEKFDQSPQEAMKRYLEMQVEMSSAILPMEVDDGLTMTEYRLKGDNLIITITADEDIYSIDVMKAQKSLLKESILEEGVKDPSTKSMLDLCKVSHTGLCYHVVGKQTKRSFDVMISSDDIREYVKTPSSLDIR